MRCNRQADVWNGARWVPCGGPSAGIDNRCPECDFRAARNTENSLMRGRIMVRQRLDLAPRQQRFKVSLVVQGRVSGGIVSVYGCDRGVSQASRDRLLRLAYEAQALGRPVTVDIW